MDMNLDEELCGRSIRIFLLWLVCSFSLAGFTTWLFGSLVAWLWLQLFVRHRKLTCLPACLHQMPRFFTLFFFSFLFSLRNGLRDGLFVSFNATLGFQKDLHMIDVFLVHSN